MKFEKVFETKINISGKKFAEFMSVIHKKYAKNIIFLRD